MAIGMAPFVVVLYGSHARGTADSRSDRDILVVADKETPGMSPLSDAEASSISRYRWQEFVAMRDYGSLFLYHLREEALVLEGCREGIRRYKSILADIPPYGRSHESVVSFRTTLSDVASAIRFRDSTPEFEAAALAALIRHSAILGCYSIGELDFGRYSSVERFCDRQGLPGVYPEEYRLLYDFRLALSDGKVPPGGASYSRVKEWHTMAEVIVEEVTRVSTPEMSCSPR